MALMKKIIFLLQIIFYVKSQFLNPTNPSKVFRRLDKLEEQITIPPRNSYYEVELGIGEQQIKYKLALDLTQSETWIKNYKCKSAQVNNSTQNNNRTLQEESTDEEESVLESESVLETESGLESESAPANSTVEDETLSAEEEERFYVSKSCLNTNETASIESIYGELEGNVLNEDVFLGSVIKATNMTLISVSDESSDKFFNLKPNLSGVLGLSLKSFSGVQFSFLNVLKNTGSITSKIFALGKSTFHIGDYPTEVKQFPKNYHTCNITMNEGLPEEIMDGWICDLTHFIIGTSQSFSDAEEIEGRVIFDSMLKNIETPEKFIGVIKAHYFDLNYNDKNCTVISESNKSYILCNKIQSPLEIKFIIGGYALIIPGDKLFSEYGNDKVLFNVVFTEQKHNVWRFGKILLDEYIIVFDAESEKVGFYGENKINFEKEWTEWWSSGFDNITSQEHMKYLIIASISLGTALLIVIICLVCQGLRKKTNDDEAPLHEEGREMGDQS